jgi:hypothetical protein
LLVDPSLAEKAEYESVTNYRERWRPPFTQLEMREMWTYSDGDLTVRAYRRSDGTAGSGNRALVARRPGTFRARFGRGSSHAGSGRWTCSPM